jgi:hypothetical protein
VPIDEQSVNDLRLLLLTYKNWRNPGQIADKWTDWIRETINSGSNDPLTGADGNALSIELVLDWSAFRISVVIVLPTLLSLVIGIWFNSRDWNDLTTIQTAWGIASYVATAGGCMYFLIHGSLKLMFKLVFAALLGIISGIKDK